MRAIILLVILSTWSLQFVASLEIYQIKEDPSQPLAVHNDVRGFSDIWSSLKFSAKITWSVIKEVAQDTKVKVKLWIEEAKLRAQRIAEAFKKRLEELREKSKFIIEKLVGAGKILKKCFEKENEKIEELLGQIVNFVSLCVADSISNLSVLAEKQLNLELNETKFLNKFKNQVNQCTSKNNTEACLFRVNKYIVYDIGTIESEVLRQRRESKKMTDDLLDTVVSCSVDGLLDASKVITTEAIRIISCAVKG